MPNVKISEHIEAPLQRVWDFISDIRRGPEWVTVMKEVLYVSDGALKKGSIYRERSKVGPSMSETEWRITSFEPPHVQVHECNESTLRAVLTMRVEPDGKGARLLHETEFKMLPVFRPLGWLVEQAFGKRKMRRELHQTVANAKRILEAESSS
jgi:carbon monoxide dehydrogenase subunit G